MNQYSSSDYTLNKLIYVQDNDEIGTAIIDTEDWRQPTTEAEIVKTTSFIANILTAALLKSQSIGKEQFDVIVYMEKFKVGTINYKFVQYLTDILKQLFPERLRKATLIDPPKYFITGYEIIKFFMDKPTRKKLRLISSKDQKDLYIDDTN